MDIKKHWKENKNMYRLEVIFIIPIIIVGIVFFLFKDFIGIRGQIYLYIIFFYFFSWYVTVITVEFILKYLRSRDLTRLKKRFKKKPKVFEYVFFLCLFWATAMITEAYSKDIKSGLDLWNFINNYGMALFTYGVASACGWYHYIERLDDI